MQRDAGMPSRRALLLAGGTAAAGTLMAPGLAAAVPTVAAPAAPAAVATTLGAAFKDDVLGAQFSVPEGWVQQEAVFDANNPASPRIVAFVSDNKDVNMALVSYPIRSDNAKLGSFGTIGDVRKNIVRSDARTTEGEVIKEAEVNVGGGPAYVFEYTVRRPSKHLLTIFTTRQTPEGAAYLITLTMQAPTNDYPKMAALYEQVVSPCVCVCVCLSVCLSLCLCLCVCLSLSLCRYMQACW